MLLKISEFLKPKAIMMEIKSKEKLAAIKEMVDHLIANKFVEDGEKFIKALGKRENLESTGIGDGIAIPHALTNAVKDLVLAFARSTEGVDFSAIDGKPSHLIFLIASSEDKKSEYVVSLAKLSRLLRKHEVREQLKNADSPKEILDIIKKNEE
ncbi:PTS system fructose-specific EIIABC component [subsurface metagenome]